MKFAMLLGASIYWHLPILVVLVSLVYSASRYDDWRRIFHHAVRNGAYVLVFMGGVFLVLFLLSSVF